MLIASLEPGSVKSKKCRSHTLLAVPYVLYGNPLLAGDMWPAPVLLECRALSSDVFMALKVIFYLSKYAISYVSGSTLTGLHHRLYL